MEGENLEEIARFVSAKMVLSGTDGTAQMHVSEAKILLRLFL
jgi:hypothetical protein